MSTVTRFKQSVSHGKECKAHQPASTWGTPRSVVTCTAYVSRDPFCPWCRNTPEAMEYFLSKIPSNHAKRSQYALKTSQTVLKCPQNKLSQYALKT
ncbi:hypothetical protein E2C01_067877 [Portunus trituberculatus]|uniref:Uncharacterized protein n=1 Tax=Portunus trituberculatus TaxID=210409 RepID=A0A5B7HUT8_PORTR|nr:hypothetical protein [Portunus trituberculatus]